MLRLDKVIKPWKESAALNDHINLDGFWNETTFLTKSGDVGTEAENRSYDYCFRHQPHWSETDAANKLKIQEATGIFLNPRRTQSGEDEYPAIPTT